jgi:hypothetical protein
MQETIMMKCNNQSMQSTNMVANLDIMEILVFNHVILGLKALLCVSM